MNKESYLGEIEKRLLAHFSASRAGYKPLPEDRHRLEGFIQGAIFMGFADTRQLGELMEATHFSVFGQTIAQRRRQSEQRWQEDAIDYSRYEQPAYERKVR